MAQKTAKNSAKTDIVQTLQNARETALRRLDRRECSAADMQKYLTRKGFQPELAEQAVHELIGRRYIDDERFSRMMIRHHSSAGKGPRYIQQKLREKGIKLEVNHIQETLQEVSNVSEADQIKKWISRRYSSSIGDPTEMRKAIQSLMRKGFSYSSIRQVMNQLGSEKVDEDLSDETDENQDL